jgi:integrase
MASYRKRGGAWYIRFVDADGQKREKRGCSDKRATQAMGAAVEAEIGRVRAGLSDPRDEARRKHETTPVASHIDDWHQSLIGKANTIKHAYQSRKRVGQLMALAGVVRLSDVSVGRVQAALGTLRDSGDGLSLRTLHHYVRHAKAFSRWLWRDGRTLEDRLAHLAPPANPESDRRHERRAMTSEEIARLIDAAATGPVVFKMSGRDRSAMYALALGTGFRASEVLSLTPECFDLGADPPTVTCDAAHSKRRRRDSQPILITTNGPSGFF